MLSLLTLLGMSLQVSATKLLEVRPLDKDYLMVVFTDGEAMFRDDARGPSAYTGHDFAEGDDSMVYFGKALDVDMAQRIKSWKLSSDEDLTYGTKGKQPLEVHRKSKVWETTHDWKYAHRHTLYLKLPEPLKQGISYTLNIHKKTRSDTREAEFIFDVYHQLSEALHVNMVAYEAEAPLKSADLYAWMGDGGERDYSEFEGQPLWLYNTQNGEKHQVGKVSFWMKNDVKTENQERNLVGSDVWNADFSEFTQPGSYRLVIEGIGCSRDFDIKQGAYEEPFGYSVRGYYYMRIGEDSLGVHGQKMTPVPRRPLFIMDQDPDDFVIYLSELHPFMPLWREIPGDTWDEPHFRPAESSKFWEMRLPGNPTNPKARGGHSDALDWDRHLAHVSNIYDQLLPYIITGGALDNDDLNIAESGNGIPDLLDEARNEVDFFLSLKTEHGYGHGLTNPSAERNIMFQAGATTMAAWANAANCAMMAEAFRISGHDQLKKFYTREAVEAFEFAGKQDQLQLDDRQGIGDWSMRGRDFRMMAAAYLYNLTGERKWEDIILEESALKDPEALVEDRRRGDQTHATAAYLFTPRQVRHPQLHANMRAAIMRQAKENNVKHLERRPSRRTSAGVWWQTPHNLHMTVLAHALSQAPGDKELFEKTMIAECDWGLGRNPSNMVEMTGLGERHVVNCYTSGRNDGTPGLHPGQTPYHNLGAWGGTHNGSHPEWHTEKCYPAWEEGWPHQEGHFNSRYTWANSEFTPRQTMRGKMLVYAYLYAVYQ